MDALEQLRKTREDMSRIDQVLLGANSDLDATRAQAQVIASQRAGMLEEIDRLRMLHKEESVRAERLEESCNNGDSRLKDLRAEIAKLETRCNKLRGDADEEISTLEELKRASRTAASDLKSIETSLAKSRSELDAERRSAIADLGLLSQAKQSIQSQIFNADEARRRSSSAGRRQAPTPGSAETEKLYDSAQKPVAFNADLQAVLRGSHGVEPASSSASLHSEIEKLVEHSQEALKSVGIDPSTTFTAVTPTSVVMPDDSKKRGGATATTSAQKNPPSSTMRSAGGGSGGSDVNRVLNRGGTVSSKK